MAMNPISPMINKAPTKPAVRNIGAATAPATTAVASTGDTTGDTLTALTTVWKNALTGRTVSVSNQLLAGRTLVKIFDTLLGSLTITGFRVLWKFFKDNASGVCLENKALMGIEKAVPDQQQRRKYITLYNAFRAFTMGYKPAMSDAEFLPVIPNAQLFKLLSNAK